VEKEAKKEAKRAGMGDSFVSMEEAKERANLIAIRVKEAKRVKAEAKRAVKAALDVCGKGGSEAGGEGGEGGEGVGEGGEGGCEGGGGGGEGGKGANSTKEPIWLEKLCRRAPRGLHGTKRAKGGSCEVTDCGSMDATATSGITTTTRGLLRCTANMRVWPQLNLKP
jgi:hypothetical protein